MAATRSDSRALWLLAVLATIAGLYFAKDVLIPLAIAVLLTFVLAPLVRFLQRRGVPRHASAVIVVVMAFAFILSIVGLLGQQLTQLAERLPQYETTITQKVQNLRGMVLGGGPLQRLSRFWTRLDQEIQGKEATQATSTPEDQNPAPVRIVQPLPAPAAIIQQIISPLLNPLTTIGLTLLFVIFFLLERESLRDRLIRLISSHDLRRSTELINDAAQRLSRYFIAQTAINAAFGFIVATGLAFIGVPNPILWGILGMLLRFVPYLGAWVAAAFPIAVSFAVDPGWTKTLLAAGLFIVIEPIIGQIIEPYLYGRSTGLAPIAVVVSAAFWTWLWGPIGLLLSTPLTMCLGVLGRHLESLEFLEIMIGDEPPLSSAQIFYQRTLAGSENDAIEQVEQCLKQTPDLTLCLQEIVIQALQLAEIDRTRDVLVDEDVDRINAVIRSLLAELDTFQQPRSTKEQSDEEVAGHASLSDRPVLCISGPSPFDQTVAMILVELLKQVGIIARLESASSISPVNIARLEVAEVRVVALVYLYLGSPPAHLRHAVRRVRRRVPSATILASLFGYEEGHEPPRAEIVGAGADACTTTLAETVKFCAAPLQCGNGVTKQPEAIRAGAA